MSTIRITSPDLNRLTREWARYPDLVEREVTRAMYESVMTLQAEVVEKAPVGVTSNLRNSIFHLVERRPMMIRGTVATGPGAPYGAAVNDGTKPHFPPLAPIRRWVERKLGVPVNRSWFVARSIQRKIGRVGTKGQKYGEQSLAAKQSAINGYFRAAMRRVTREMSGRR